MDSSLYRIYSDNIPLFNGDEHILPAFIRSCEELVATFQNAREPLNPVNKCIISTIISRLRGKAAEIICPRNELNTWALIKQTLRDTFSDGRNLDCLLNDLMSTTINRNETLTQFGLRLQTLRSLLISKLNEQNETPQTKQIKIDYYEQITLKTYINNLPEKTQIIVKCKSPDSIEKAISFAKMEEADLEFRQRMQHKNVITGQNPQNKPFITKQNYQPPINNNYQSNFQNQNPFFQQRQQFPSQPINIQPRQIPTRSPTNNQVFGTKQNVFKPNPNRQIQDAPELMSLQSRQSRPSQNLNQQRPLNQSQIRQKFPWFQPAQTPKFISQELHAIDDEQCDEQIYNYGNNETHINDNEATNYNTNYQENNYIIENEDNQNFLNCDNYNIPDDYQLTYENTSNFPNMPQTNRQT